MKTSPGLSVIFDGPPSHESGRFVEVEIDGVSVSLGRWYELDGGLWALSLGPLYTHAPELFSSGMRALKALEVAVQVGGGDPLEHEACCELRAAIVKARGFS